MRLLHAELAKLARPLSFGVAAAAALFCLLLAAGGSHNAALDAQGAPRHLPSCAAEQVPAGPQCSRWQAAARAGLRQIQAEPAQVAGQIATGSLDAGGDAGGAGELGSTAEVLARVEQLSREALAELSHLLGALRRDPDAAADMPPAPTLAGLDTLIASARQAGVSAELAIEGQPRNLSPGVELSGYRIVSEALANAARHAPGATARVVLRYAAERLEITVKNTTPPHGHHRPAAAPARPGAAARPGAGPRAGLGLGVRGMRERAELYGGTLDAGPCPGGGFLVTATLPYGPAADHQAGDVAGHQAGDGTSHQADGKEGQTAGDEAGHRACDEAAPTGGAR